MKRHIQEAPIDVSTVSPQNFVAVMILLRNLQHIGALSIKAVNIVIDGILEKPPREFQLSPAFWRKQFEQHLCPLIAQELFDHERHGARDNMDLDEFQEFEKAHPLSSYTEYLMRFWDESRDLPNAFYMFIAHLLTYIRITTIPHLEFRKNGRVLSIRIQHSNFTDSSYPTVNAVHVETANGAWINHADWPTEIKTIFPLDLLMFTLGPDGNPQSALASVDDSEPMRTFRVIYQLLIQGWRLTSNIKDDIPASVLSCVDCGAEATYKEKYAHPRTKNGDTYAFCSKSCQLSFYQ